MKDTIERVEAVKSFLEEFEDQLPPPNSVDIYIFKERPFVQWLLFGDHEAYQKRTAALIVKTIPGTVEKKLRNGDNWMDFSGTYKGVDWEVTTGREAVCERVVVGTEIVEEEVPDPDAPRITVTTEKEIVEWKCDSLLAKVGE